MKQYVNTQVQRILSSFVDLSTQELQTLTEQLLIALSISDNYNPLHPKEMGLTVHAACCPHCGSIHFKKDGFSKMGIQKYRCLDCKAYFRDSTHTTLEYSRKNIGVWGLFIRCTLERKSLRECAEICGISQRTSFTWRHKLLHVLAGELDNTNLAGIVELDDTFFSVSYKGNHTRSENFDMPRKAHKRGGMDRKNLMGMVSVLCAVSRGNGFKAQVTGLGAVTVNTLQHSIAEYIAKDALVLSDGAHPIHRYFKDKGMEHIAVLSSHGKKKRAKKPSSSTEVHHINNVNALHARIRKYLEPFCGVSSKYLGNYIALCMWLENNRQKNKAAMESVTITKITEPNTYMPMKALTYLPHIPSIAA